MYNSLETEQLTRERQARYHHEAYRHSVARPAGGRHQDRIRQRVLRRLLPGAGGPLEGTAAPAQPGRRDRS